MAAGVTTGPSNTDTNASTSSSTPLTASNNDDPVTEWMQIFGVFLMKRGLFDRLFELVGPRASLDTTSTPYNSRTKPNTPLNSITHEQLIVLELASSVLEDTYAMERFTTEQREQQVHRQGPFAQGLKSFIHSVAMGLVSLDIDQLTSLQSDNMPISPVGGAAAALSGRDTPSEDRAIERLDAQLVRGLAEDYLALGLQVSTVYHLSSE